MIAFFGVSIQNKTHCCCYCSICRICAFSKVMFQRLSPSFSNKQEVGYFSFALDFFANLCDILQLKKEKNSITTTAYRYNKSSFTFSMQLSSYQSSNTQNTVNGALARLSFLPRNNHHFLVVMEIKHFS